jgi:hypothetical protein
VGDRPVVKPESEEGTMSPEDRKTMNDLIRKAIKKAIGKKTGKKKGKAAKGTMAPEEKAGQQKKRKDKSRERIEGARKEIEDATAAIRAKIKKTRTTLSANPSLEPVPRTSSPATDEPLNS